MTETKAKRLPLDVMFNLFNRFMICVPLVCDESG
jgi:hypothetical protein